MHISTYACITYTHAYLCKTKAHTNMAPPGSSRICMHTYQHVYASYIHTCISMQNNDTHKHTLTPNQVSQEQKPRLENIIGLFWHCNRSLLTQIGFFETPNQVSQGQNPRLENRRSRENRSLLTLIGLFPKPGFSRAKTQAWKPSQWSPRSLLSCLEARLVYIIGHFWH